MRGLLGIATIAVLVARVDAADAPGGDVVARAESSLQAVAAKVIAAREAAQARAAVGDVPGWRTTHAAYLAAIDEGMAVSRRAALDLAESRVDAPMTPEAHEQMHRCAATAGRFHAASVVAAVVGARGEAILRNPATADRLRNATYCDPWKPHSHYLNASPAAALPSSPVRESVDRFSGERKFEVGPLSPQVTSTVAQFQKAPQFFAYARTGGAAGARIQLQMLGVLSGWAHLRASRWQVLAGDVRLSLDADTDGSVAHGGTVIESMTAHIGPVDLARIAAFPRVEIRIGVTEFALSAADVATLRALSARLAP